MDSSDIKWEVFNEEKEKTNYPLWPNEAMVKLVFGNYLKNKINITPFSKVLDVGCGFGNNLLPFLNMRCGCFGTEVTEAMAAQTQEVLSKRGCAATIRYGKNTHLPFQGNMFDLLLSINVIHYEENAEQINNAFFEYKRVLREGGRLVLMTVGPAHDIFRRAEPLGNHHYEIKNYDFRNGEKMFFFEDTEYLKSCMDIFFSDVETGRVTEELMNGKLDFLIGVGRA